MGCEAGELNGAGCIGNCGNGDKGNNGDRGDKGKGHSVPEPSCRWVKLTNNGRSDLQLEVAWNDKLFLATEGGIQ